MKDVFKNVILLVASAQRHSDEGKVCYRSQQEVLNFKKTSCCYGYDGKDAAIIAAISIINKHPLMGVSYYVKNNGSNVIVYFNFKVDGKRLQVSFHTFSSELRKLVGKGSPCRWKEGIGSRETCHLLLKLCGEESEIKVVQ